MASTIRIAGVDYPSVPRVNLKTPNNETVPFVDVSGDTVTAASLLAGFTAHGADGSAIAGGLLDGFDNYATDLINLGEGSNYTNLAGWVLDLGFVPKLFLMYSNVGVYDLEAKMKVVALIMNRMRIGTDPDSYSTISRSINAANYSSTGPRVYSYTSARAEPYESGNVKGVIGVNDGGGTTIYRLFGQYRYMAFG